MTATTSVITPVVDSSGVGIALAVGDSQVGGALTIGNGAARSANISIGCGTSSTGNVNIKAGLSGVVNIAASAGTTTTNIGTGPTTGTISIGSSNAATTVGGTLTSTGLLTASNGLKSTTNVLTPVVDSSGVGIALAVGDSQVGGALTIGNGAARSANISIGCGTSSTGNVNIKAGLSGVVNIAASAGTTTTNIGTGATTGAVSIGNSGNTTTVYGNLVANNNLKSSSLDTSSATTLNIGATTATSISLCQANRNTAILGTASVAQDLTANTSVLTPLVDALTFGGSMSIGTDNATVINVGQLGYNVAMAGFASVAQNLTANTSVITPFVDALTFGGSMSIGTYNASTITVGQPGQNVAMAGTASVAQALTAITSVMTPYIDTPGYETLEIGKSNATTINLGRTLRNVAMLGTASVAQALTATTSVLTPTVEPINATSILTIAGTQTTTGALNIGTNASRTSNIVIGSATNTGKINLLTVNTGNTNDDPAISIGTTLGAKLIKIGYKDINNTVNLARLQVAGQDIQPIDASGTMTLGYNQTTGPLYIGGGNGRTEAASININTGNTCSTSVNINTGTGTLQSSTTNIGTGTTTGAITIGNTNNTTTVAGSFISSLLTTLNAFQFSRGNLTGHNYFIQSGKFTHTLVLDTSSKTQESSVISFTTPFTVSTTPSMTVTLNIKGDDLVIGRAVTFISTLSNADFKVGFYNSGTTNLSPASVEVHWTAIGY